jgi:hypothetical protein
MKLLGPRAGVVVVILAAVAVAVSSVFGRAQEPPRVRGALRGVLTGPAPWPANTQDLRARLDALGLPALAREGTALHIHVHLDVFVAGRRVVVPAGIGIDPAGRFISPVHTHDPTGIIHVESPTIRTFTLGEFFGVWGVRFNNRCLGGYCADGGETLRVYVGGRRIADPTGLALAEHQEIVVAFGTRRELQRPIPARYDFPAGL